MTRTEEGDQLLKADLNWAFPNQVVSQGCSVDYNWDNPHTSDPNLMASAKLQKDMKQFGSKEKFHINESSIFGQKFI